MITHDNKQLKLKLVYDPASGKLFRKLKKSLKEVGCLNKKLGYKVVRVGNTLYYSHRLAWILYYGEWPVGCIDHIDGDKLNNSLSNLRQATSQENMRNLKKRCNTSSIYKGVTWCKRKKKWKAQIRFDDKNLHLGYFLEEEGAAKHYNEVVYKFHKEFSVFNEVNNEV